MNKPAVNIFAVVVVVALQQAVGALWYSQRVFGQEWMNSVGMTPTDVHTGGPTPFFIAIVASLLMAVVVSILVSTLGVQSFTGGIKLGFFLWLGLSLGALAVHYSFSGRSLDLILIDGGHELLNLLIAGGVIAGWKRRCKASCGCAH